MFNKYETVCFLGDSITYNGKYIKEIFEYLAKNRKDDRVKLFNCGVSGDRASRALNRLYCDCLVFNPDTVVIALGVNDIERSLYLPSEEDKLTEKEKYKEIYKKSITEITEKVTEFGSKVILCTPVPTQESKSKEKGCNEVLREFSCFLRKLADEKGFAIIDYFENMLLYIDDGIFEEDALHPNDKGQHLMAQIALKELGYTDNIDVSKMPVWSTENEKRFNAEQNYRKVMYYEWGALYDVNMSNNDITYEEKKEMAQQKREDGIKFSADWFVDASDVYLKYCEKRDFLISELLNKTIDMYKREG